MASSLKLWCEANKDTEIDAITFAGNTEPLLHPQFPEILEKVFEIRNLYRPNTNICLFTGSSRAAKFDLSKIDRVLLKLDVGSEEAFQRINHPRGIIFQQIVEQIKSANPKVKDIETMIVGGKNGNNNEKDIQDYIRVLKEICPQQVGLYTILYSTLKDRDIEPVDDEILINIAERVCIAFQEINQPVEVIVYKKGIY
jgi:wyosine [tRNA(Phe)-imidazoG37] synthetase (radical SAM superfamily)